MTQVLFVGMTTQRIAATEKLLRKSGFDVVAARGFEEAVRLLGDHSPALLISELRLGDFNGLHLVIRSQRAHPTMRVILLDSAYDSVLELEAQRHGAVYLVEPVDDVELLAQVSRMSAESPQRRWPRKAAGASLVARVAHRPARVIDLSYGGLRLEVLEPGDVASRFEVALPDYGIGIQVQPVWTSIGPGGWLSCGAEVSQADPRVVTAWRTLVDSVHGAA